MQQQPITKQQSRQSDISTAVSVGMATVGTTVTVMGLISYAILAVLVIIFFGALIIGWKSSALGMPWLRGVGIAVAIVSFFGLLIWGAIAIAMSFLQVAGVAVHTATLVRTRDADHTRSPSTKWARILALVGIVMSISILSLFGVAWFAHHKQQIKKRHELDSQYIVRVAQYVAPEDAHHDRWSPALSHAALKQWDSSTVEILLSPSNLGRRYAISHGTPKTDWPRYQKAIDDRSDYRYVGTDLTSTPALYPESHRIIVLYNKKPYDGGRHVAFANNTQRFVKEADLPALFADASAARAKFGLPPITLDGPAPPPPP